MMQIYYVHKPVCIYVCMHVFIFFDELRIKIVKNVHVIVNMQSDESLDNVLA